jgi:nucleotide-binding universal stress UspA family protein
LIQCDDGTFRFEEHSEEKLMIPTQILFCADFSDNSLKAREIAVAYAKEFSAGLIVLNVVNTRFLKHPALLDLPVYEEAFQGVEEMAKEKLDRLGTELRNEIPNTKTFSRKGVPGEEIVYFASEENIDLIIMGTKGRTGFSHLLIGSTAETVVRHAPCAVITVKSK